MMAGKADCEHDYLFITSGRMISTDIGASSHLVEVCKKCGNFSIHMKKNGVVFDLEFTLMSYETINASGQYLRLISAPDDKFSYKQARGCITEYYDDESDGE